jgi:hypothetical protein
MKRRFIRTASVAVLTLTAVLIFATAANASLTINYVFNGHGGFSSDGLGQNGTGGTVEADVPAGSTVQKAFLYGTYYFNAAPSVADRTIDFDGTMVETVQISGPVSGCCELSTTRADVTAQVAAKVGGGGGITSFAVNTDPDLLDGVALVVVYSNAAQPENTIAILDGSASTTGDTATFVLASPLDKTVPGFQATMALGSGFSYQGIDGHVCGGGQFSLVDVNSQRLTSCAGNYDDGVGNNGGLITVGGVGDSIDNPADPNRQTGTDDELYNLDPFLAQGATSIEIKSSNPSDNDNLFLSVISISARATVTNEDCDDGMDNDGDGLVDGADPDCAPPPPTGNTCGEVRGDGLLTTNRDFRWEFYNVKYVTDAPKPSGQASFNDKKNKVKFTSTSIDTLVISGNQATLTGSGIANGAPVTFTIVVTDRPDTYSVELSSGYRASGNVTKGRGVTIKLC